MPASGAGSWEVWQGAQDSEHPSSEEVWFPKEITSMGEEKQGGWKDSCWNHFQEKNWICCALFIDELTLSSDSELIYFKHLKYRSTAQQYSLVPWTEQSAFPDWASLGMKIEPLGNLTQKEFGVFYKATQFLTALLTNY